MFYKVIDVYTTFTSDGIFILENDYGYTQKQQNTIYIYQRACL